MQEDADETIARIGAALRPLPEIDPSHKARVLVAVAAERERERAARARTIRVRRWLGAGSALAAAAMLAAVLLRGSDAGTVAPTAASVAATTPTVTGESASAASVATQLAARRTEAVVLQPVQFVFRAPSAKRVSIVGDFNGWDPNANTMTRDAESGLWDRTVALRPGRHVYAFVVDDSVWMRDPQTPAAVDADFGRPGSVLLVGRP